MPGDGGIITGAVLGGISTAVQANQQKIADQKQRDAISDAEKAQQSIIDQQKAADAARKQQEAAATQQAFATTAAARNTVSGAALPGAVADTGTPVGNVPTAAKAAKSLIGG